MNEQPEALRLADWLDGSSNGPMDARHKAAAELRLLHKQSERLAGEVANRNRRALAGDEAVAALDRVHSYYETRITTLEAANEAFAKRQTWWNDRMFEMEAALRQAVEALDGHSWEQVHAATIAAKKALGEQK